MPRYQGAQSLRIVPEVRSVSFLISLILFCRSAAWMHPSIESCLHVPQGGNVQVQNIYLDSNPNTSTILRLECTIAVNQSQGAARVFIVIQGRVLYRTEHHGNTIIRTNYNLEVNSSWSGSNFTTMCLYRYYGKQAQSSAQNCTFNHTTYCIMIVDHLTTGSTTTDNDVRTQSPTLIAIIVITATVTVIIVVTCTMIILVIARSQRSRQNENMELNEPTEHQESLFHLQVVRGQDEGSQAEQQVQRSSNDTGNDRQVTDDVDISSPITCTQCNDEEDTDIVRGAGVLIYQSGYSKPIKVFPQVYAKEKDRTNTDSNEIATSSEPDGFQTGPVKCEPLLAEAYLLSNEYLGHSELDTGDHYGDLQPPLHNSEECIDYTSFPCTTSAIPRNGNEDNLRRRFNQRKPVVIANGAMEKSNDGVEYVYKSMRSFCVAYEDVNYHPDMETQGHEDSACFSAAEQESHVMPTSSIVTYSQTKTWDDSDSEELSDSRRIGSLPAHSSLCQGHLVMSN